MLRFLIDSTRNKEGEEENEEEAGRRGDGKEDASSAREEEVDESIDLSDRIVRSSLFS